MNNVLVLGTSILLVSYFPVYAESELAKDLFTCAMYFKGLYGYVDNYIFTLLCYETWKAEGDHLNSMSDEKYNQIVSEIQTIFNGTDYTQKAGLGY